MRVFNLAPSVSLVIGQETLNGLVTCVPKSGAWRKKKKEKKSRLTGKICGSNF